MSRIALFSDIHFGRKNNSQQHNQDCLDFIRWFCSNVRQNRIDKVIFMGDWFENRNAVNVSTLDYSYEAFKELSLLGLPVYVLVGNHDLYHRENRKIYSTRTFHQFNNITTISEPTVLDNSFLLCPFLFKHEYADLAQFNNLKYWFGHFEFRNFVVTGSDRRIEHGPDHKAFSGPQFIFSGHFHKRQITDNVVYIGNVFPMDYGDAWDDERGMCIIDTSTGVLDFTNWEDCPRYRKIKLSELLSNDTLVFPPKCRVRCLIDSDIGYSDAQALKDEMVKQLGLREFSLEENITERLDAIAGEDVVGNFDLSMLNDAVIKMIQTGVASTTTIDPEHLVELYQLL